MPFDRIKGKAEPKDKDDSGDKFEDNPHLAAYAKTPNPTLKEEALEAEVVSLKPKYSDPFKTVFQSEVSSIYAMQVGNGCIIKTIHAGQVHVVFVPGATLRALDNECNFAIVGHN